MLCGNDDDDDDDQGAITCSLGKVERFWPGWAASNGAQQTVWWQDIILRMHGRGKSSQWR
jgi:hypothetical protein